jgi:CHAT domain-containing protein
MAQIHARKNETERAEAEFQNTIGEIERRQARLFKDDQRFSWLDSLITFYQEYIDFLIAQDRPERALQAAESSRSKVLADRSAGPADLVEYRNLARRTGGVLLEYWMGPGRSYLWVITPERVFWHVLPPGRELQPLLRSYRAVINSGRNPLDVAPDTGAKLYDALLAPAARDVPGAKQFIIVPDGELYSLNFETLPDGANAGRFWIDRATIRISPSLNYLVANGKRSRDKAARGMLLIGDPVSALPQYPRLEFAGQEIKEIAAAMPPVEKIAIEGVGATPQSYLNSQPGRFAFVHFSAHAAAAARRESALDSSVILSGPPDRCRLTARDVLSVPLHADLVTVSACRSAGGKTYGGEGLVGFAWAFMKAGAGNVIAGLWDVNDRSTVQLMSGLYRRIAAGAPIAEALRSSKLDLIHGGGSYAKPFYWAPFELYTARPD